MRFAFWSGEEDGLLGSTYYVAQLTAAEIKGTALNLNFDMIASPNYANFVYDGDGNAARHRRAQRLGPHRGRLHATSSPSQGEATEPTDVRRPQRLLRVHQRGHPRGRPVHRRRGHQDRRAGRRSSAAPPASPTTRATTRRATPSPTSTQDALDIMSDAVAHATLTFAETTSAVNGTAKGKGTGTISVEVQGQPGPPLTRAHHAPAPPCEGWPRGGSGQQPFRRRGPEPAASASRAADLRHVWLRDALLGSHRLVPHGSKRKGLPIVVVDELPIPVRPLREGIGD